eukprot:3053093-Prorocentrum_lima.AAC.1
MTSSLVGSEMCIRDSRDPEHEAFLVQMEAYLNPRGWLKGSACVDCNPVSYTHLTLPTICSV